MRTYPIETDADIAKAALQVRFAAGEKGPQVVVVHPRKLVAHAADSAGGMRAMNRQMKIMAGVYTTRATPADIAADIRVVIEANQ